MADHGFLSRWSRLKAEARTRPAGTADAAAPAAPQAAGTERVARPPTAASTSAGTAGGAPQPTLEDALRLDAASDYSAFVARGVDAAVRRVALRRLFADPHFNTMDGLDVYIGDYTKADPVAPAMLESLRRAAGLLRDEQHGHEAPAAPRREGPQASAPPALAADGGSTTRENDEH